MLGILGIVLGCSHGMRPHDEDAQAGRTVREHRKGWGGRGTRVKEHEGAAMDLGDRNQLDRWGLFHS